MEIPQLSWLTPLQGFKAQSRAGRPRKVNAVVLTWIRKLREDHTIREIAEITKLNPDTVSDYLHGRAG